LNFFFLSFEEEGNKKPSQHPAPKTSCPRLLSDNSSKPRVIQIPVPSELTTKLQWFG